MLPTPGAAAEYVILYIVMGLIHPGSPIGTKGFPVHKNSGLSAQAKPEPTGAKEPFSASRGVR
jgi:hypothetical protein